MIVRILGLAAIVLGALAWNTGQPPMVASHIGTGMCVALVVFAMAVIALIKKRVIMGLLGVVLALLLPAIGFMQLPLIFHVMGGLQIAHIAVALSVIGVAERLYASIQQAG